MKLFAFLFLSIHLNSALSSDELRVALSNYKPFVSKDGDNFGLHSAIVLKVLKKMKVNPKITFYSSWGRVYKKVQAGEEFLSFPWNKTQERLKDFYFSSVPIDTSEILAFYKKETKIKPINKWEDLRGYKIACFEGYSYTADLEVNGIKCKRIENEKDGWEQLSKGQVEIVIQQKIVGDFSIKDFLPGEKTLYTSQSLQAIIPTRNLYLIVSKKFSNKGKLFLEKFDEELLKLNKL